MSSLFCEYTDYAFSLLVDEYLRFDHYTNTLVKYKDANTYVVKCKLICDYSDLNPLVAKTITKTVIYHVSLEEGKLTCNCGHMKHRGIICRHIFNVYVTRQYDDEKALAIHQRWSPSYTDVKKPQRKKKIIVNPSRSSSTTTTRIMPNIPKPPDVRATSSETEESKEKGAMRKMIWPQDNSKAHDKEIEIEMRKSAPAPNNSTKSLPNDDGDSFCNLLLIHSTEEPENPKTVSAKGRPTEKRKKHPMETKKKFVLSFFKFQSKSMNLVLDPSTIIKA